MVQIYPHYGRRIIFFLKVFQGHGYLRFHCFRSHALESAPSLTQTSRLTVMWLPTSFYYDQRTSKLTHGNLYFVLWNFMWEVPLVEVNSWRDFVSCKVVACRLVLDRKISRYQVWAQKTLGCFCSEGTFLVYQRNKPTHTFYTSRKLTYLLPFFRKYSSVTWQVCRCCRWYIDSSLSQDIKIK